MLCTLAACSTAPKENTEAIKQQDRFAAALAIQLANTRGVTGKVTYIRDTLTVGDASIAIFRHESLTSEQVLELIKKHYVAWAANQPGGRQGR